MGVPFSIPTGATVIPRRISITMQPHPSTGTPIIDHAPKDMAMDTEHGLFSLQNGMYRGYLGTNDKQSGITHRGENMGIGYQVDRRGIDQNPMISRFEAFQDSEKDPVTQEICRI
jgi:hypothetical protein